MQDRSIASLVARLTIASSLSFAGWAHAGECPAGKAAANPLANAPSAPVGVTDTELASVDLSKENVKLDQRRLRLRHMTIAPGGIVPLHSHAGRPALIIVVTGTVVEHRSTCSVGIVHKAGEIASESDGISHWWKNVGTVPAVLLSADVKARD